MGSFYVIMLLFVKWFEADMQNKSDFKVRGLTQKHKDFLYQYAQNKLGSRSRSKAILHLINEKMVNPKDEKTTFDYPNSKDLMNESTSKNKKRVQISLRESDFENINKVAEINDISIQHYIISLILKDLYNLEKLNGNEIEQLRKSNFELHKIGVNINQIAKAVNTHDTNIATELPLENFTNFVQTHVDLVKNILHSNLQKY